ncbi:MAG: helix-turn-helix transcriptional regulator [Hyphomonadaceae bacterium JAD_PAG50586_4]|nr:MAG: helix-turn-helix transcriptional regulator [Hyphomonadaceae bacterium JAD_PAG50586_4]
MGNSSPQVGQLKSAFCYTFGDAVIAAQLRAARALLNWSQTRLAETAGLSVETIKRLERMDGPLEATTVATIDAITRALGSAGVEFTNGDEPGVKLKAKRKR